MRTFELEVITPERVVFKGHSHSLIVPAYKGYLGIMAGHAPFICAISPGQVTVRKEDGDVTFQLGGGFMETTPSKTTILADESR